MDASDAIEDAIDRIRELVASHGDLDVDILSRQPAKGSNSIGWFVWHVTRVQDGHVADLLDAPQIWVTGGFAARLGREPDPDDTGYAHSEVQAAGVRIDDMAALLEYHGAVAERTIAYLESLGPDDLDRVIDTSYDPPVTVGVRLVSVVSDSFQHLGQAAYVRGLFGV